LRYLGIDLHKYFMQVCVLNSDLSKEKNYRVNLCEKELSTFLAQLDQDCQVVFEASGNSYYLYDLIQPLAGKVLIANPKKLKAISSARIKTDRIDARILATLLKADLIPAIWVPSPTARGLRTLLHHRVGLNKTKNPLKNRVGAILLKNGLAFKKSDLFGKAGKKFLAELKLSRLDQIVLTSNLKILKAVEDEIQVLDQEIANLAVESEYQEEVKLLLSFPGIDYYTALLLASEIGEVTRFPHPKNLASYSGLVTSVYATGKTCRRGGITREGRKYLRWGLVQVANAAIKSPGSLREFYQRLKQRKGHGKAIVALARKILTLIWVVLTKKEEFREKKDALLRRKVSRMISRACAYEEERDILPALEGQIKEYLLKERGDMVFR